MSMKGMGANMEVQDETKVGRIRKQAYLSHDPFKHDIIYEKQVIESQESGKINRIYIS